MGDLLRFPKPHRYHGAYDVLQDAVNGVIREHGEKAAISALKLHVAAISLWDELGTGTRAIAELEALRDKSRNTCGND